jgi:PBP1b-binding outer membrane lipoprotein LpoB
MRFLHLSALLLPFLAACSSTIDRRVDPDNPDTVGGAVLESQDIRTMADKMARDIIQTGVLASAPAGTRTTFHITEMRNESSDTLNRTMILMKLRTELFRGLGNRVDILDRSAEGLEAVRKEREAKRAGAVTANAGRTGDVLGSDYVLKGVIQDRVKQAGKLKSAYYLVTFELTDLETGRLVWTGDYEAKFESEKSVISR